MLYCFLLSLPYFGKLENAKWIFTIAFYGNQFFVEKKNWKWIEIKKNSICFIFIDSKLSQCVSLIQNTSAYGHSLVSGVKGMDCLIHE